MGAQNFNFAPEFPHSEGFSAPNFAFVDESFPARTKLSGQFSNNPKFSGPAPRCHDVTHHAQCSVSVYFTIHWCTVAMPRDSIVTMIHQRASSLFWGLKLKLPNEGSVWSLWTCGTTYWMTFVTPAVCRAFETTWRHAANTKCSIPRGTSVTLWCYASRCMLCLCYWLQLISQALQSAGLSTICTYSPVDVRAAMSAIISSIQKQYVRSSNIPNQAFKTWV